MTKGFGSVSIFLVMLTSLTLTPSSSAGDSKEEQLAKDAATQFFQALNAKRLDDLMKLVDVPWWTGDEVLVKDRDELRKLLKRQVELLGECAFPTEVTQVWTYAEARKKIDDAGKRAVLDQVLDPNDWVVGLGKHAVLIRLREGKVRVVGGAR